METNNVFYALKRIILSEIILKIELIGAVPVEYTDVGVGRLV